MLVGDKNEGTLLFNVQYRSSDCTCLPNSHIAWEETPSIMSDEKAGTYQNDRSALEEHWTFQNPCVIPKRDPPSFALVPCIAACIEPRLGAQLIRPLSSLMPCPSFSHLKRVRRTNSTPATLEILVCPAPRPHEQYLSMSTQKELKAAAYAHLSEEVIALVERLEASLCIIHVPEQMPCSLEQAEEWSHYWPLSYKRPHPGLTIPPEDVPVMHRHMTRALQLASTNRERGGVFNACIIVNPLSDSEIVQASDCRQNHPLHHAAMQAAAAAGEWQLRVWPVTEERMETHVFHEKLLAVVASKRRRMQSNGNSSSEENGGDPNKPAHNGGGNNNGPFLSESERSDTKSSLSENERPYLCTGFDAYLVGEPCLMCAMALVHSRVRRVVFCRNDATHGALGGSGTRIHSLKGMNHYYDVIKLPVDQIEDL